MKFLFKKIYISIILSSILMFNTNLFAKDNQILYSGENISNYFLGIMSANQDYNDMAFKYLKKAESLKDKLSQYNVEFVRTLILLE